MLNLAHGAASVLGRPLDDDDDDADCRALSAEAELGLCDPTVAGRRQTSCAIPAAER